MYLCLCVCVRACVCVCCVCMYIYANAVILGSRFEAEPAWNLDELPVYVVGGWHPFSVAW